VSRGGKRAGAGRPAPPPEQRRDKQLKIRISRTERAALEEAAARQAPGSTVQAWLRDLALRNAALPVRVPTLEEQAAFAEAHPEYSREG